MLHNKILLEAGKAIVWVTTGALIQEHYKWLSPLLSRLDTELQQLLEPHQWYQGARAMFLTTIVLIFAFSFILYFFHRNRSKEYIEMKKSERSKREKREMKQRLLNEGIEFDVMGTLTRMENGERFCPYCYTHYRELNSLKKMTSPKKSGWHICTQCGNEYL